MANKTIVLTNEQLVQLADIASALFEGKLDRIPSRYEWVEELLELPQFMDFYSTGFNYLSTNAKEFEGTYACRWMYSDLALKLPRFIYRPLNKAIEYYVLREWSWKAAYITATSPMLDEEIPDVEELQGWFCSCGDEAEDPGMGCIACFTGIKEEMDAEGPYGGAFRDEMDYVTWREGSGFVQY